MIDSIEFPIVFPPLSQLTSCKGFSGRLITNRIQLSVLDNWIFYPPWIMGMTVTMSPSFTDDSLTSKSEESIPFTTIKE